MLVGWLVVCCGRGCWLLVVVVPCLWCRSGSEVVPSPGGDPYERLTGFLK